MSAVIDNDATAGSERGIEAIEAEAARSRPATAGQCVAKPRTEPIAPSISEAIELDPGESSSPPKPSWHERLTRRLELSAMLRVVGAGAMVTAISVFLLMRWEAGNDLFRYSLLFGQTLLLILLGFATSRFLHEPKSARVFIALGVVSSAATFTVLGALIYSVVQWDTVSTSYPSYAFWHAGTRVTALTWTAGSLLALLPLSRLGFIVLARPAARSLAWLYMANAALLLLPLRDPALMAGLALGASVVSFVVLARVRGATPAVRTAEGRIARLLALLPIGIVAGRCAYLYAADATTVALLALLGYIILRQLGVTARSGRALQRCLEVLSVVPAAIAALALAKVAVDITGTAHWREMAIAVATATLFAAFVDLAVRSAKDGRGYAATAAIVALAGALIELAVADSIAIPIFCAVISGGVTCYAHNAGFAIVRVLALFSLLVALGDLTHLAIRTYDLGGWAGLALLGTGAILAAAAIERHGERIKALFAGPGRAA